MFKDYKWECIPESHFWEDFVTTWEWIYLKNLKLTWWIQTEKMCQINRSAQLYKKNPMSIFLKYTFGFNGELFVVYKSFVVLF